MTAIDTLFRPKAPCNSNLFDCAAVLAIILMDALREATNPQKLLSMLFGRGPVHLSIALVNGAIGKQEDLANTSLLNQYFLTDTQPARLFDKPTVPSRTCRSVITSTFTKRPAL